MWDLIVSVPDHCLSFYFRYEHAFQPFCSFIAGQGMGGQCSAGHGMSGQATTWQDR